jgi:CIC family chloride channel protein
MRECRGRGLCHESALDAIYRNPDEGLPGRQMISGTQQTLKQMTGVTLIGLVIGLVAAFATTGFVEAVAYLNHLLYVSLERRAGLESGQLWLATIAVLTLGGLLVGLLLRYGTRGGEQAGPADTIFAVQLHERLPTPASGAVSTMAAALALGCGASVGQYGPLVYLGTLIGQLTNRLHFGLGEVRSITIACGVAAAISTAFNAPLAALIFTHEVVLRHYSPRTFTAVAVASACGYLVADVIFSHPPLFLVAFDGGFRGVEFLLFALEGIACGMLAVIYMRLLTLAEQLAASIDIPSPLKPMIAGFALAMVALQVPEVLGAGQDVLRQAVLVGGFDAQTLLLILVAKLAVTALCIGFGFAGGVFFPSMLVGVLFGALFAHLVPGLLLDNFSGLSVYAVCGMVAVMSPVIGAPMTALLLVFEFTRSYEITIAAMVAVVFANLIAHKWYARSYYDFQLGERGIDLSQGRERAYLLHQKVAALVSDALPVMQDSGNVRSLRERMKEISGASAVIVDEGMQYRGLVTQTQLKGFADDVRIAALDLPAEQVFTEATSIWEAMQAMRAYIGEAIPVVDSGSGRYLGAIPESAVIDAYLDSVHKLRREEHEV